MIALGLYGGHDSSACLIEDGKVLAAIQEERINKIKHFVGFPRYSIDRCLEATGIRPAEVDVIAFSAMGTLPTLYSFREEIFPENIVNDARSRMNSTIWDYYMSVTGNTGMMRFDTWLSKKYTERMIRKTGFRDQRLFFADHHEAHAMTAKHMDPGGKHLVITLDARGNDFSGGVYVGMNGRITERISKFSIFDSLGYFYGNVTEVLGYRMNWDECKTMALAPFGNPETIYPVFKRMFDVDGLKIIKRFPRKRIRTGSVFLKSILNPYEKKDIAAAAQMILEDTVCKLVKNSVEETGIRNVLLSGGIFLNVKLNKRIMEMDCVRDVKIFPAAGDAGISVGSALSAYAELSGNAMKGFNSPYLGDEFSESEIENVLKRHRERFRMEYREDVSEYVGGELLPRGKIGGWFQGRMEFGPRALGNRSVLADPRDKDMPGRIRNGLKDRPAFQPFCQSVLDRFSNKYVVNKKNVDASYMIMAFESTGRGRRETPAVVHIDNSVRPQVVSRGSNPKYYRLLEEFGKETGVPVVLNTSFNVSNEPIVNTPLQAIKDFEKAGLDFLVLGNHVLERK